MVGDNLFPCRSGYKTPNNKTPKNKTPNATERPITKRPMLQNAQCSKKPKIKKRPNFPKPIKNR